MAFFLEIIYIYILIIYSLYSFSTLYILCAILNSMHALQYKLTPVPSMNVHVHA